MNFLVQKIAKKLAYDFTFELIQAKDYYDWIKYAAENNPYHVGDVITDRHGSGKIVKMMFYEPYRGLPCVRYRCINLTKKGEPNKREPFRDICQYDISKKEEIKK